MDQIEVRAYETLGFWTITAVSVTVRDSGEVSRRLMYRGDHTPIDEEDPEVRAVLLLSQLVRDLNDVMGGVWDNSDSRITETEVALGTW